MKRRHYLVLLLLLASMVGRAQTDAPANKLNLGMDFKTHGEACSGGLPRMDDNDELMEDHSDFLLGRFRLNVDYERPGLQAHAVIQNKAVWGTASNQSLNLYEGWVKMTSRLGFFAQVGRVALAYDDERIIGTNDFAMASLSHDILRVGFEGQGHKLHAILAYNQNSDMVYKGTYYDGGAQYYKTMQMLWYHYDAPWLPIGASLLFMNTGLQAGVPGDTLKPIHLAYQQMFGGYLNYDSKHLTIEGSYYQQTGMYVGQTMQSSKIDAWMASAKIAIKPSDHFGFELGYDHLSGDSYVPVLYGGTFGLPIHEVNKGFSPLFGSRNKFYGMMDYFYESAYTNGFTPGLQNAFAGINGKPTTKLSCSATYHYLAVATDLEGLERSLGHSVDLQLSYDFTKDISLTVGYTQMVGTETMMRLKQENGSKKANWGWFSLVVSPSLFTAKW